LVAKPLPNGTMPMDWFKVGLGNTAPGAPSFLLVHTVQGTGPVLWVGQGFIVLPIGNADPDGIATAHVPFPLDPSTIGVPFFTQWMIDDGGVRAFSNAARFVPFQF
jgi:hypothetical protein